MATDVIEALSARLIRVAEERGCTYEAWIFTNGYLLSEDVVDLLLRCRINNVHIPLDGTETTNDATRRLIGGRPTFQRIVDNLALLKPPLKTLIRATPGNPTMISVVREMSGIASRSFLTRLI